MFRQGVSDVVRFTRIDAGMKPRYLRIIKFGGSLERSGALQACMERAARLYHESIVLVPGGGAFAEHVRLAQNRWHFDDATAHTMAILAMQQMAWLMNSLCSGFMVSATVSEAARQLGIGNPVIWSPDVNELNQAGIAASWDVTSDSLAAWLTGRLEADELILIKSASIPTNADLQQLVETGILDRSFLSLTANAHYKITVVNKDEF